MDCVVSESCYKGTILLCQSSTVLVKFFDIMEGNCIILMCHIIIIDTLEQEIPDLSVCSKYCINLTKLGQVIFEYIRQIRQHKLRSASS